MHIVPRRAALRRACATAALLAATAAGGAQAATVVAGGATLPAPTYLKLFAEVLLQTPPAYSCASSVDICYASVGATAGVAGFLNNDSTQLGLAAGIPVDIGASDQPLATSDVSGFSAAHGYQLIQIPAFGTSLAIPFNYAGQTTNGAISLTDADLCGIFSGKIKDWSGTSAAGLSGPIAVVYRQDGAGQTYLLTAHLAAVCKAPNPFVPTTKFATLFPGYTTSTDGKSTFVPAGTFATAVAASGSSGEQLGVVNNAQSIGYIGPNYTAIAAVPTLATGVTSAPVVAAVKGILPTVANTTTALGALKLTPVATDPNTFDGQIAAPKVGYPIVGFTTLVLSSKYTSAAKVAIVKKFLGSLYNQTGTCGNCVTDITNAGFAPVPGVNSTTVPTGTKLAGKIVKAYLAKKATVPFVVGPDGR